MRIEMYTSNEQFQLKGSLLLLIVPLRNDGILLEGLQASIVLKRDISQLGQLV